MFFEKILSRIKKVVKTFSIFNKFFSKNDILLCALRAHMSKINNNFIVLPKYQTTNNFVAHTLYLWLRYVYK